MIMHRRRRTRFDNLSPHDKLTKYQKWYQAAVTLLIDLIVVMALAGLGFTAWQSTQNHQSIDRGQQILQLLQCHLLPGHPCYQSDRASTHQLLDELDRFQVASSLCIMEGNKTVDSVIACVKHTIG